MASPCGNDQQSMHLLKDMKNALGVNVYVDMNCLLSVFLALCIGGLHWFLVSVC